MMISKMIQPNPKGIESGYLSRVLKVMCLFGVISCSAELCAAQDFLESPKDRVINQISSTLCGKDGKIAKCIGELPSSCATLMRPFVMKCETELSAQEGRQLEFERCFWREYLAKYGKRIDLSGDCAPSDSGKSPLQELPPELDALYEPLRTP